MTSQEKTPRDYSLRLAVLVLSVFVFLIHNDALWSIFLLIYHFTDYYFIDWLAVTAASDAFADGYPVFEYSPYDILNRPHVYSGWWLYLHYLGMDRFNGLYFSLAMVIATMLAMALLIRPKSGKEFLLGAAILLSPPFMLGYERANNDLFIFLLLCLIPLTMKPKDWGLPLVCVIISLATILKYYPAVLFALPFAIYGVKTRTALITLGFASLSLGQIISAGELLGPLRTTMPDPAVPYFTFGGEVLFRALHFERELSHQLSIGAFLLLFGSFSAISLKARLKVDASQARVLTKEEVLFMLGALVVVGCFVAHIGYAYRLIFCVFSVPLIFSTVRDKASSISKAGARLWLALAIATLVGEVLTYNILNLYQTILPEGTNALVFSNLYRVVGLLQWAFIALYLYLAVTLAFQIVPLREWLRSAQSLRGNASA